MQSFSIELNIELIIDRSREKLSRQRCQIRTLSQPIAALIFCWGLMEYIATYFSHLAVFHSNHNKPQLAGGKFMLWLSMVMWPRLQSRYVLIIHPIFSFHFAQRMYGPRLGWLSDAASVGWLVSQWTNRRITTRSTPENNSFQRMTSHQSANHIVWQLYSRSAHSTEVDFSTAKSFLWLYRSAHFELLTLHVCCDDLWR
jgi:hypothetical protein